MSIRLCKLNYAFADHDNNSIIIGDGFRFGATRGPNGEKVELSFRRGNGVVDTFDDFCSVNAVHTAMLVSIHVVYTNVSFCCNYKPVFIQR